MHTNNFSEEKFIGKKYGVVCRCTFNDDHASINMAENVLNL
jgi:hypothetical protein